MVGTFFVEVDNATMDIGMEDGQTHVGFTIGLHIPDAMMAPMVVVAPFVDLSLTTDGDAVDIGVEHFATIYQQLHIADAIMMVNTLCIIVGPQGKAHPTPCGEFTRERPCSALLLVFGLTESKGLLVLTAIEHTLALHRHSHKGMGLWGYGVSNEMPQEHHRVAHRPRFSIVNFKVQMGACRMARIAADGYQVASMDGELRRWENHRQRIVASAVQQGFVLRGKALQVAIDAGMSVRMSHVDSIAKAVLIDS